MIAGVSWTFSASPPAATKSTYVFTVHSFFFWGGGRGGEGNSNTDHQQWCKDCVDWAEKTEVGEALPHPGERICEEEFETLKMRVADFVLNEDYENGIPEGKDSGPATTVSINDFDDDYEEEFTLLPPGAEATTVTDSIASPEDTDVSVETPGAAATSTEPMAPAPRAPHWFLGFMNNDSPSTSSTTPTTLDTLDTLDLLDSIDTPDESISELSITAGSQTHTRTTTTAADTNASVTPGQTGAVSFNAWSPEGNFERMIKEPTVVSEESGWKTVTRTAKGPRMVTVRPRGKKEKDEVKVGKNGWVKVVSILIDVLLVSYWLTFTFVEQSPDHATAA